jgi:WD40-like Beta Propeller Repeat
MIGCRFRLLAALAALWGCNSAQEGACLAPCSDAATSESRATTAANAGAIHVAFCGDGVWDAAREECDDGSACQDGRSCSADRLSCQSSSADTCQPRDHDGCSAQCTVEPGYVCALGRYCLAIGGAASEGLTPPGTHSPAGSSDGGSPPLAEPGETLNTTSPAPSGCRRTFGSPELVTGLDPNLDAWAPSLASDGHTLFFTASQAATVEHIYFSRRADTGSHFATPSLLADIDSGSGDGTPVLSFDRRTLYFCSRREGGSGDRDLWFATRSDPLTAFGLPRRIGGANSPGVDHLPWVSADELTLLYVSSRAGGLGQSDVWRARRASRVVDFGDPQLLDAVSSSADEGRAVESSDGTVVVFSSNRARGQGDQDLWLSTREQPGDEFGLPVNLTELNSATLDGDPFLSADDHELFFTSQRSGRMEIWRALVDCE